MAKVAAAAAPLSRFRYTQVELCGYGIVWLLGGQVAGGERASAAITDRGRCISMERGDAPVQMTFNYVRIGPLCVHAFAESHGRAATR